MVIPVDGLETPRFALSASMIEEELFFYLYGRANAYLEPLDPGLV